MIKNPTSEQNLNKVKKTDDIAETRRDYEFNNPRREFSWDDVERMAQLKKTIASSQQTFDRLNYLEIRAKSLEQQIISLYSNNWIIPKIHARGISGYYCKRCKKFCFRPIMDIGFDKTMQSKHRCGNYIGCTVHSIPSDFEDIQSWMAQVILNQMHDKMLFGGTLFSCDISPFLNECKDENERNKKLGIPDTCLMISLNKKEKFEWLDKVLANSLIEINITRKDMIDFLKITMSTYAVIEIPEGNSSRYFFMMLPLGFI